MLAQSSGDSVPELFAGTYGLQKSLARQGTVKRHR